MNWMTVGLLFVSNFVMCYAWYGHIGRYDGKPIWMAVLISWLIAGLEYCLVVPANRMGAASGMKLEQLKIIQEAISLTVFIPFSMIVMKQGVSWNYAAAMACIMGAVYFIFRG